MRVVQIDGEPVHVLDYQDAAPGGGTQLRQLPIFRGTAEGIPPGLDAVLVTSDLQGRARLASAGGESRLLGEALAEEYMALAELETVPPADFTGVILAGDLYAAPGADKMGATGDVRAVWRAFAAGFRWVVGVAGNHDLFGSKQELERFRREAGVHLLDGDCVVLDGLRVGGVGGICGNPRKENRREAQEFVRAVQQVLASRPHALVLHEGPDGGPGRRGNADVRAAVDEKKALVICGHCHWPEPLVTLRGGTQVLNVDARAVVLERA